MLPSPAVLVCIWSCYTELQKKVFLQNQLLFLCCVHVPALSSVVAARKLLLWTESRHIHVAESISLTFPLVVNCQDTGVCRGLTSHAHCGSWMVVPVGRSRRNSPTHSSKLVVKCFNIPLNESAEIHTIPFPAASLAISAQTRFPSTSSGPARLRWCESWRCRQTSRVSSRLVLQPAKKIEGC